MSDEGKGGGKVVREGANSRFNSIYNILSLREHPQGTKCTFSVAIFIDLSFSLLVSYMRRHSTCAAELTQIPEVDFGSLSDLLSPNIRVTE